MPEGPDPPWTGSSLGQKRGVDFGGAKGFNQDADRFSYADGIGQLYLAPFRQPGGN